jgi:4-hydroxyphenylpyruvate dioxygenase
MVDVIDPDGLVRSKALESSTRKFRLTLNGAESHRTLAGNFLADSFGSAVQHIALATDDIFSTVAALNERGFAALPIPQNYYDDLAARFDLDEQLLHRMQELNIIYDEDDQGSFYQIYSLPFSGGLFFEILQRNGGYDGYGAPNAPFRIAAQKRYLQRHQADEA